MISISNIGRWILRQPRWRLLAAAIVVGVAGFFLFREGPQAQNGMTFTARRGPLDIHILEGGGIEAMESQEIRSEIKGMQGTKVLKIVDEGYLVTDDDVKNGKILVELDSSEIRQRTITEEIQFQSTLAMLTEAQQAYDIQVNQNITDIKAAEQKAKFARMDFEKYMGETATQEILTQLGMDAEPWTNSTSLALGLMPDGLNDKLLSLTNVQSLDELFSGAGSPLDGPKATPVSLNNGMPHTSAGMVGTNASSYSNSIIRIEFAKYADTNLLGDGAANQQLRKLQDDVLMSKTDRGQAQTKYEGTKRLAAKQFVTKIELENDQITVEKADLKQKTADTSLNLFIKYEFPKAAEEFLSKYDEALRALERTGKEAISKLAQAHAKLKSAEGRFKIEAAQRADLYDQMNKCFIKAMKSGLVVYANNDDYRGNEGIREGATVRERQRIITIPDMTQMAVRIKIHESNIKRVVRGLKARITVDAFPDEKLTGEITRVSVLPDSQNRWMNPDLKVYITFVGINGAYEWVKPGMSAKVEIMVNRLADVVYIPLQAVSYSQGKQVCYVVNGNKPEERVVAVGDFTDEFIEIKSGLKEGEIVLLRAPEGTQEATDTTDTPEQTQQTAPQDTAKPVTPAVKPAPPSGGPGPAVVPGSGGNGGGMRQGRDGGSRRERGPGGPGGSGGPREPRSRGPA